MLWFEPRDAADLASKLEDLERDYDRHKARAAAQVSSLRPRLWSDVATEYLELMLNPGAGVGRAPSPEGEHATGRASSTDRRSGVLR